MSEVLDELMLELGRIKEKVPIVSSAFYVDTRDQEIAAAIKRSVTKLEAELNCYKRIVQEMYADVSIILATFDSTASDPKEELEKLHTRLHKIIKDEL